MEFTVQVSAPYRLWARAVGPLDAPPLLLVMGANANALTWPPALVERLATRHRVIVYDHRDTGRSTWAFDEHPYQITDLAGDALAVLDAAGVARAHVVGMSMGGVLVQLLALDHPDRLLSATAFCTAALGAGLAGGTDAPALPDPDPRLLKLWQQFTDERDREAELDWRVEHWRLLNGDVVPFDAAAFRAMEESCIDHAGTHRNAAAHARAGQDGLARGDELGRVRVPFLVVEAPEDPINPPPHAAYLAGLIPSAKLVTVPGMGHALAPAVLDPFADAVETHIGSVGPG
ncbi:alpha/beta fold hydrolase [Micromonospora cathayae]|uniref:Alpha/beta fold hydrolase n=1 Tax=Micromonospora cathayae TaxID=3028804 RepID=A0ABY7ZRI1_9ACTN|nr:alpha/beta fold hydrolase [Micromonospora sp. HUAS 3]WDZ85640.1 alpha/beta fold hydrolase [Micromonospora sp. HUAS 3]